ncbi:glycosyltransferase [Marispirochaeta aestuarii]|uniref:glycosyltransferase n=1 Tax=Marispirochaeta aestuarii TaxID=1963862 RepID=UPI002ABD82ED|nr:glycosyltransferase [Marispirochaeta aestuarii]
MKKIFGFIRYSILVDNTEGSAWGMGRNISYGKLKEELFSETRLKQRGFLFENFTLPSLASLQSQDHELRIFILTSELLPAWHMDYLNRLKQDYPFIEIYPVDTKIGSMQKGVEKIINERVPDNEVYCTFRIDDDDALSLSFIQDLKKYIEEPYVGMGITFPLGYSGYFDYEKEKITLYGETYIPMTSQGLSLISRKGCRYPHIFSLIESHTKDGHRRIDSQVPVILHSKNHSYFRVLHERASLYFGKSSGQKLYRTSKKLQRPAVVDDIVNEINISRDLFVDNDGQLIDRPRSLIMKLKRKVQRLIQK